jgi:hypothetical protein
MLIAQEKRKTNIAEYVLYMWQVEDLIRAYKFDIELIDSNIISQFNKPDHVKREIKNWYANLILMMHEEYIKQKGHLKFVKDVINDLNNLHIELLTKEKDPKYTELYKYTEPNIREFKNKLQDPGMNEIEICLSGLYALLLMRLQKRRINSETTQAMMTFSYLLAMLSKIFKERETISGSN